MTARRRRAFMIGGMIAVLAAGCERDPDDDAGRCLALTRDYRAALDRAIVCSPGDASTCAAGRPMTVSLMHDDGTSELEGLCRAPCFGAVNPSSTAELDSILDRFHAAGCELGPCWCPRPESMPPACLESGECWGIGPSADPP